MDATDGEVTQMPEPEKKPTPSQETKPTKFYDLGRSITDKVKKTLDKIRGPNQVYKDVHARDSAAALKDRKDQIEKLQKE